MCILFGYEYDIYPTEEGEIAIDCTPAKGRGVLVLCAPDDSVACFQVLDGPQNMFRYKIKYLPYHELWFLLESLQLNHYKSYCSIGFSRYDDPYPDNPYPTKMAA